MVSAGERESDEKKRDDSFNPLLTLCFDGKSPFFSFLISETKLHSILRKMKRERSFPENWTIQKKQSIHDDPATGE